MSDTYEQAADQAAGRLSRCGCVAFPACGRFSLSPNQERKGASLSLAVVQTRVPAAPWRDNLPLQLYDNLTCPPASTLTRAASPWSCHGRRICPTH
jgi:hypothetical protein